MFSQGYSNMRGGVDLSCGSVQAPLTERSHPSQKVYKVTLFKKGGQKPKSRDQSRSNSRETKGTVLTLTKAPPVYKLRNQKASMLSIKSDTYSKHVP